MPALVARPQHLWKRLQHLWQRLQHLCKDSSVASLVNYIHDNELDILAITKTWFSDKDAAVKAESTPDGYKLYDVHRSGRNGGGTTLITHSNLIVKQVVAPMWCSFEFSEWILIDGSFRLRLAVFYRPPYSTKHPVTISSFVSVS